MYDKDLLNTHGLTSLQVDTLFPGDARDIQHTKCCGREIYVYRIADLICNVLRPWLTKFGDIQIVLAQINEIGCASDRPVLQCVS